jgi:hypothetical protein
MKFYNTRITPQDVLEKVDSTDLSGQGYGEWDNNCKVWWNWSNQHGFIMVDDRSTGKKLIGYGKKTMDSFNKRWNQEWKKERDDRMVTGKEINGMKDYIDVSSVPDSIRLSDQPDFLHWIGVCVKYLTGGKKTTGPTMGDVLVKYLE